MTIGRPEDYRRAKTLFNRGKHPSFIGVQTVQRAAINGGLTIYSHDSDDIAVAVVNPRLSVLQSLNVSPDHRGHGLGKAIMDYLRPSWIRSIESRVSFFEACGYECVGELKQGRSLKVQIMVREGIRQLSGRVAKEIRRRREAQTSLAARNSE